MIGFKKYWITLAGIGLGTAAGFLYWKYVGCTSGTCPITSSPTNSSMYGAMMGGLVGSLFGSGNKK